MDKSYKIYFDTPPRGLTITERQHGYIIDVNTTDWNVFVLWFIFSSLFIVFTSYSLHTRTYSLLLGSAVFFYLSAYATTFTFIRATIVLEKNNFKFYTRRTFFFQRGLYEVDLSRIQSLRLKGVMLASRGRHVWSASGSSYIELKGKQRKDDCELAVYRQDYTVFITRFLKNYLPHCQ